MFLLKSGLRQSLNGIMAALLNSFDWHIEAVSAVAAKYGLQHLAESAIRQVRKFSSGFTGMAAAEAGRDCVAHGLAHHGIQTDWTTTAVCDICPHSQQYLLRAAGADCCINRDVLNYLDLSNGYDSDAPYFEQWQRIAAMELSLSAPCIAHGCNCSLQFEDCNVSGFPCTPWSVLGSGTKLEHKDCLPMVAWARAHTLKRTKVVIGENTTNIWSAAVRANFPYHNFQRVELAPSDVMFSLQGRPRSFFLLTSDEVEIVTPWSEVVDAIKDVLGAHIVMPSAALLADDAEIRGEELAMSVVRDIAPMRDYGSWRDLSYLLTPHEIGYCRMYEHIRRCKHGNNPAGLDWMYHLGDNPAQRLCWSERGSIPTFRRNCTMMWIPALGRWVTMKEKMASMGWPSYAAFEQRLGVALTVPTPGEGRRLLGNSMHVASVGVATLAALASIRLRC
jgi:hypothetical protein